MLKIGLPASIAPEGIEMPEFQQQLDDLREASIAPEGIEIALLTTWLLSERRLNCTRRNWNVYLPYPPTSIPQASIAPEGIEI